MRMFPFLLACATAGDRGTTHSFYKSTFRYFDRQRHARTKRKERKKEIKMSDFEDNGACVGIRPVSRWKNFKVPRTGEWVRMRRGWPEEKWEDFIIDLTEDDEDESSSDGDSDSEHESNPDAADSDQTNDPNDEQTTNLATLPLLSSTPLTPPLRPPNPRLHLPPHHPPLPPRHPHHDRARLVPRRRRQNRHQHCAFLRPRGDEPERV